MPKIAGELAAFVALDFVRSDDVFHLEIGGGEMAATQQGNQKLRQFHFGLFSLSLYVCNALDKNWEKECGIGIWRAGKNDTCAKCRARFYTSEDDLGGDSRLALPSSSGSTTTTKSFLLFNAISPLARLLAEDLVDAISPFDRCK